MGADDKPFKNHILAIDPGKQGAFCVVSFVNKRDGKTIPKLLIASPLPLCANGKSKEIDFNKLKEELLGLRLRVYPVIFIEHAKPYAMGVKSAFSYGSDFKTVLLAAEQSGYKISLVPPDQWTKYAHQDLDPRLKPKEKSLLAFRKFFPNQYRQDIDKLYIGRSKKPHSGIIDASLIAMFGKKIQIHYEKEKGRLKALGQHKGKQEH